MNYFYHHRLNKHVFRTVNLIENHEYEFRVAAVNAAGQGPWSSSSDGLWCRTPPCKFSLLNTTINSENIKLRFNREM